MQGDNKKLAAIVFIDIVGYTAMMSKDVHRTLEIVDKIRFTIQNNTSKTNGDLLKEMGDGFLLSFHSPSNAIKCALNIQKDIVDFEAKVRIGIHVGEIIVYHNDIYGDGVNIASRLQSIASPSTIYISGRVYEDIINIPEIHTKYLGEKKLKNVGRPIKVYEILMEASTDSYIKKVIIRHKKIFISASIVLILALLFSFIYVKIFSEAQTTEVKLIDEKGNTIARDIPKAQYLKKVVVFLFQNEGKEYDWMSAGIPMMISADLDQDVFIQVRDGLFYIDDYKRSGVSDYTKIPDNILRNIADVYKLEYFITGTFKAVEENDIKINIKTYDTQLGKLLGQHDISGDNLFQLIDQLSSLAKRDLGFEDSHINNSEDLPISELLTGSLSSMKDFSVGMENILINSNFKNGIASLKSAIEKDSIFTQAYYQLSNIYMKINKPTEAQAYLDIVLDNPYRLTERDQFLAKSQYYFITGDNDKRIKVLRMYMDLYPLDIEAYYQLGESLFELGNYDEAENVFIDGLKIDDYRGEFLRRLGHINKAKRNYNEALKYYEMYRDKYPDVSRTYRLLGGFHLETGNFDEAEINLEKAVLLDRRSLSSRIDLIEIKQRKGQFEEAIDEYITLLEYCNTSEDSINVMLAMSDYYYLRGEVNRGIQIKEKAFEMAASIYNPINMLFYTVTNLYWYQEVGRDSIIFNVLKREEEKISSAYSNITAFGYISYYLDKEDLENSKEQYDRMTDFIEKFGSPSKVEEYFKARLYKLEGKIEEAIKTYEVFRKQNTYLSNAKIDNRIAECYILNSQYEMAENVIIDVLKAYPFDPMTLYHLALIYQKQGKLNDARASLEILNGIWKNADEEYVYAQKAKSLYNQLQVNM